MVVKSRTSRIPIFADVPSSEFSFRRLDGEGLSLIDVFTETKLAKSKSEARRAIEGGGPAVNNEKVKDIEFRLKREHLASETMIVLQMSKKKAVLRFV